MTRPTRSVRVVFFVTTTTTTTMTMTMTTTERA